MSNRVIETFHLIVEWAALGIEVLAVAVIVAGVVILAVHRGTVFYLFQLGEPGAYESYKHQLGKVLLLGMELLVAADVVRTVALEPTLRNVVVLGLLVIVRTFLSWSMAVEIDGCWPWHGRGRSGSEAPSAKRNERRELSRHAELRRRNDDNTRWNNKSGGGESGGRALGCFGGEVA